MQGEEIMGDYHVRVKACVDKIKILGEEILNEFIMNKVLRILLPKWKHVEIIIEE